MRRVEYIGSATLFHCDCLDLLSELSRGAAVIADPPYGIDFKHGGGGRGRHRRRNDAAIAGDHQPFDPTPWLTFSEVILWGANHFAMRLPHGRWLAWNKLGDMKPWDDFSDVEFAWQNKRAAERIFSLRWKGLIRGEENGEVRHHPSQKPVGLMRWCIEATSSSLVIDPYMGSGTTGIACHLLGRRFIGIELDAKHFDTACRRIEEAQKRPVRP